METVTERCRAAWRLLIELLTPGFYYTMKAGWIKIYQEMEDHWIWSNPKYLHAWVYMLLRANYQPTKVLIGSTLVQLKRGEFITSIQNFSGDTHLSIQETRTFWALCQRDKMIAKKSTSKLTKVTVCEYERYQDGQHTQQQTSNKPATTEKEYTIESIDNFTLKYKVILSLFPSKFQPQNKSQQNAWVETLDKLVRLDGLDLDTIEKIIRWARADEFWSKNFMTLIKLRQKNKEQIPYWLVFQSKMEGTSSTTDRYKKISEQKERR